MEGNSLRGRVSIEIGGRELYLRFNWEALSQVYTVMGNEFEQQVNEAVKAGDMRPLAQALTAGLHECDPTITSDWIMSQSPPIVPMQEAFLSAFRFAYFGDEDPEQMTKSRAERFGDGDEEPVPINPLMRLLKTGFGLFSRRRG